MYAPKNTATFSVAAFHRFPLQGVLCLTQKLHIWARQKDPAAHGLLYTHRTSHRSPRTHYSPAQCQTLLLIDPALGDNFNFKQVSRIIWPFLLTWGRRTADGKAVSFRRSLFRIAKVIVRTLKVLHISKTACENLIASECHLSVLEEKKHNFENKATDVKVSYQTPLHSLRVQRMPQSSFSWYRLKDLQHCHACMMKSTPLKWELRNLISTLFLFLRK